MAHGRRRTIVGALVLLAVTCGACANEPVTPAGSTAAPGASAQPAPAQLGAPPTSQAPAEPAAPAEPTGPATLFGRVVDVPDPVTVVVDVAGTRLPVGVLGVDETSVPSCARADALAFARGKLVGKDVTLVPDATLPATPPTEPRRAYVVLTTQESYTDSLVGAGWAAPAGEALYRPLYDTARRQAESEGLGRWGPPCVPSG